MSLELDDILKLPNYEAKCNLFAAKVNEKVAMRYPDLVVQAENSTKHDINNPSLAQEVLPDNELRGRIVKGLNRAADAADQMSTFCNIATVDIWAWDKKLKAKLFQATQDVIRMARRSGSETPEVTRSIKKVPLNVHLFIVFE